MKAIIKIKYIWFSFLLAGTVLLSCSEMDDTYDEFIKDGEVIYSKRVDSVAVYPGRDRIKVSLVNLGPKVDKVKIYWNNKADSIEVPVTSTNGMLDVIIPNMTEGTYSFNIFTFDKAGNKSVMQTAEGNVYGENFNSTLRVRPIKNTNIEKGVATVNWDTSPPGSIYTEVKYTDNTGAVKIVKVLPGENVVSLPKYKPRRSITYKTLFLPDPTSIDTFFSETSTREIIQVPKLVDKSKFANVKIVGDRWDPHLKQAKWSLEQAWDGVTTNEDDLFHATRTGFPAHITIDIGTLTQLTHMKMWTRLSAAFKLGTLKKFEIYGRADAPNLKDKSLNGWTKIMNGQSIKPSGLPDYKTNEEDLAYAKAGEDYLFNADAEPVRYIRFRVLDAWGPDTYWYITELSLFGFEQ